jgi:hypothetical protein
MSVNDPLPDKPPLKPGLLRALLTGAALGLLAAAVRRQYQLPHPLDNTNQQIPPDFFLLVIGLTGGAAIGIAVFAILAFFRKRPLNN